MAELTNPGEEIVKSHTTEEVVKYLAKESKTLWSKINREDDIDQAIIRNIANVGTIFGYLWLLEKKLNGEKPATVL